MMLEETLSQKDNYKVNFWYFYPNVVIFYVLQGIPGRNLSFARN